MFDNENVKKIVEELKKVQSQVPEQELEETSKNIQELADFIVQLHLKTHSKTNKPHKGEDYGQETARAP